MAHQIDEMITEVLPLEDINKALDLMHEGKVIRSVSASDHARRNANAIAASRAGSPPGMDGATVHTGRIRIFTVPACGTY